MDYQGFRAIEPTGFFKGVARDALRGRWGLAFGVGFLYLILVQLPVSILDSIFGTTVSVDTLMDLFGYGSGTSVAFNDYSGYQDYYTGANYVNAGSNISGIYTLLTSGAFTLGLSIFVIHIIRRAEAGPGLLFSGFSNYLKSLGTMILIGLICFGVVLVFMIPMVLLMLGDNDVVYGISFILIIAMLVVLTIVYLTYGLAFYILADNPKIGVATCLRTSRQMMKGNKGKLFLLYLSFIGWALLYVLAIMIVGGIFTFAMFFMTSSVAIDIIITIIMALGGGILTIYMFTAEAAFYEKVSGISSGMFNLSQQGQNENPSQSPDNNQNTYLNNNIGNNNSNMNGNQNNFTNDNNISDDDKPKM